MRSVTYSFIFPRYQLNSRLLGILLLTLMSATLELKADTELNIPGHRLSWSDEFEGDSVDPSKWDVNVGVNAAYQLRSGQWVEPHWFNEDIAGHTNVVLINSEEQYYTPNNVAVDQGVLKITSKLEGVVNPYGAYNSNYHRYTSGKLNTADEFQFKNGIVRWRAQLPAGSGMWPALWMLNNPQPDWYWDDEIDVMEARGSQPTVTTSAHHFKNESQNNFYNSNTLDAGKNLQESFNEYALEWKPDSLRTTLNGREVFYDEERVPQDPMFLIMNAAVGGFFDPAGVDNAALAEGTTFSIDWVRVWQTAPKASDLSNGGLENFQGSQWADWNTVDDGNLRPEASPALHGGSSARIGPRNALMTTPNSPNLFDSPLVSPWQGWLNQSDAEGNTAGGPIDLASVPASGQGNTAVLSVHQSSSASSANAVIYRQLSGVDTAGLRLTYTGTVVLEEEFASGSTATAFIRVFSAGFGSFIDHTASVTAGGNFSVEASIPTSDVEAVQIGFESTGIPGSAGRLAASALFLANDNEVISPSNNRTGFEQVVMAVPGQVLRYGVLTANDPLDPLSSGAEGRMTLEFLDEAGNLLQSIVAVSIDENSATTPTPTVGEATAPGGTVYAQLSLERFTIDELTDVGGAFLIDAVSLQDADDTELPLFSDLPSSTIAVAAGEEVNLAITVNSATPLTYQWYQDGVVVSTSEDYRFEATSASEGVYFIVASNEAGPVVGGWSEVIVEPLDSDSDRISDSKEISIYGTNPNKADTDGDGSDDYTELFITRTDPLNGNSRFTVTSLVRFATAGTIEITFASQANLAYRFEASQDLENWQPIGPIHAGTETSSVVLLSVPVTTPPLRFFRVVADQ